MLFANTHNKHDKRPAGSDPAHLRWSSGRVRDKLVVCVPLDRIAGPQQQGAMDASYIKTILMLHSSHPGSATHCLLFTHHPQSPTQTPLYRLHRPAAVETQGLCQPLQPWTPAAAAAAVPLVAAAFAALVFLQARQVLTAWKPLILLLVLLLGSVFLILQPWQSA